MALHEPTKCEAPLTVRRETGDCGAGGGSGEIRPYQIRHDAATADGKDEAGT